MKHLLLMVIINLVMLGMAAKKTSKRKTYDLKDAGDRKELAQKTGVEKPKGKGKQKRRSAAEHYGRKVQPKGVGSVLGTDTSGVGPGRYLPTKRYTRDKIELTAWNDLNHIVERKCNLDPLTNKGAYATAGSSGFCALIEPAIAGLESPEHKKDFVEAQQIKFYDLIWEAFNYLHHLGQQAIKRRLHKFITESDASGYWTQQTWDAHLNGVHNKGLMVPLLSVQLALFVNVFWKISDPDALRNIPASFYSPFCSLKTSTNAATYIASISADQSLAKLHAAKAQLKMVPLTRELIENCYRQIRPGGAEHNFWWLNTPIQFKDAVPTVYYTCVTTSRSSTVTDTEMSKDSTTSYTNKQLIWEGDRIPDCWALAQMVHYYEATHNPFGMLQYDAPAASKLGIQAIAQDDVVFTELNYPAGVSSILKYTAALYPNVQYSDTDEDTLLVNQDLQYIGKDIYHQDGITKAEYDDWRYLLIKAFQENVYPLERG